jgi:amphi-Trp domain-containing protein
MPPRSSTKRPAAKRPATTRSSSKRAATRDLERTYTRAQFVAKLRRLADALETGRPFAIQVAGERLWIPAAAAFNIEHDRSGDTDELEFQLRWQGTA